MTTLRRIALIAPIALVLALGAGVVHLVVSLATTDASAARFGEQVLLLAAGSIALLGGATMLALPVALALVARARRAPRWAERWAAVPPIATGLVAGWAFAALRVHSAWVAALLACALVVLPRFVTELGASTRDPRAAGLIDSGLALGLRRPTALRLALAGDATLWRTIASTVAISVGDGVPALAAALLVGGRAPTTAEITLLRLGQRGGGSLGIGAGALALFVLIALAALRFPRLRRSRIDGAAPLALLADVEGARS